jgi:hypothetical protein
MASLSPAGGPLLETTELEFVTETITADFQVDDWSFDLVPISPAPSGDANFSFSGAGSTFDASYISEVGLFPLQFIRYLDPSAEAFQVDDWDQLPDPSESPEVVKMIEDTKDLLDWQLIVTATGIDTNVAPPVPATVVGTYDLRVFANYDTSKELLKQAVEERR